MRVAQLSLIQLFFLMTVVALLVASGSAFPPLINALVVFAAVYAAAVTAFCGIFYSLGARRAFCVGACPIVWLALGQAAWLMLASLSVPYQSTSSTPMSGREVLLYIISYTRFREAERLYVLCLAALSLAALSGAATAACYHLFRQKAGEP